MSSYKSHLLSLKSFITLARLDKPTGYWLLFLPCFWGLLMASPALPPFKFIVLFWLGAVVMRGAGCTYNDMVDKEIDKKVERTALRPLAAGHLSSVQAAIFLALQLALGAWVLFQLPSRVWPVALGVLGVVAFYPWAKRFTFWPQIVLGIAFNWGVFVSWLSVSPSLTFSTACLYLSGIFWTLAYDTVYAFQDIEDDTLIGVKSTARRFQNNGRPFVQFCYCMFWFLIGLAGYLEGYRAVFLSFVGVGLLSTYAMIRHLKFSSPKACLRVFKNNVYVGVLIVIGLLFSKLTTLLWGFA